MLNNGRHLSQDVLERFESEQSDLGALCAARPLRTSELLAANDYYGMAATLKRYADYPDAKTIRAVIPHGVYLNDDQIIPYERTSLLPAVLAYPDYRAPVYARLARTPSVLSSAPFLYAEEMIPPPERRVGALYFPVHSTHRLSVAMDHAAIAEHILEWPDELGPVTVMMYWRDYELGYQRPYVDRGIPVASAGHMYDPMFLPRLAYLLKRHALLVTNGLGSHVFYGVQAGCAVRLVDHEYEYAGNPDHMATDAPTLSPERRKAAADIERAFSVDGWETTEEQRALTDYHLGSRHRRGPHELAELLDWLEHVDRYGLPFAMRVPSTAAVHGDFVKTSAMPRAWRRSVRAVGERVTTTARAAVESAIAFVRKAVPALSRVRLRRRD